MPYSKSIIFNRETLKSLFSEVKKNVLFEMVICVVKRGEEQAD